jgi:hypothetical protein
MNLTHPSNSLLRNRTGPSHPRLLYIVLEHNIPNTQERHVIYQELYLLCAPLCTAFALPSSLGHALALYFVLRVFFKIPSSKELPIPITSRGTTRVGTRHLALRRTTGPARAVGRAAAAAAASGEKLRLGACALPIRIRSSYPQPLHLDAFAKRRCSHRMLSVLLPTCRAVCSSSRRWRNYITGQCMCRHQHRPLLLVRRC